MSNGRSFQFIAAECLKQRNIVDPHFQFSPINNFEIKYLNVVFYSFEHCLHIHYSTLSTSTTIGTCTCILSIKACGILAVSLCSLGATYGGDVTRHVDSSAALPEPEGHVGQCLNGRSVHVPVIKFSSTLHRYVIIV